MVVFILILVIKKTNFDENKIIKIATCGVNPDNIKNYFKLKGYKNIKYVSPKNAEFIIMTNRVTFKEGLITCFEKFKGIDVFKVERKGFLLSTVRKIEI